MAHLNEWLSCLSDKRIAELAARVSQYESTDRLTEDVASMRKMVARQAKHEARAYDVDTEVAISVYKEAASRYIYALLSSDAKSKSTEPVEPSKTQAVSESVEQSSSHRAYVIDELDELTDDGGDERTWTTRDGKVIPFTVYEYELEHEGYTTYSVEFSLWSKSVKISLVANSASPDAHNPTLIKRVMHSLKVPYANFMTADHWVAEERKTLAEYLARNDRDEDE